MPDPLPPTVLHEGGVPVVAADSDGPAFRPPLAADELGVLAGYRVQKLLGKGGMGAVYLALDDGLRRRVALKVMLPRYAANADANERFRREARAAAAVRHDNVVTVYQVGEDCGTPFLAMELLTGYPLNAYLKRKGRLTVPQALRVGVEVASGLAAAHAMGLVHRDIKPANLWLEAPQGRIKILDFGLAKPTGEGELAELTGEGAVMGTPAYMSPEQTRGGTIDARSDLFSLGVVLYQLCTGARPFDRATAMATAVAIASDEPTAVRDLNPDVPEAFATVIHALLAKAPAQRPQTAAEVARRLRELERTGGAAPLPEVTAAPAAPQVVYVPIQVTAYEPGASAFANLDSTETNDPTPAPDAPAPEQTARQVRPLRFPWRAVAASLALLAVAIGAVAIYPNRPKPTPAIPVEPPIVESKGKIDLPPKKPDPQREFALWVFERGGTVDVAGKTCNGKAELPDGPLAVTGVTFAAPSKYTPSDDDVPRFDARPDLAKLKFDKVDFTDAGFAKLLGAVGPRLAELWLDAPKLSPAALAGLTKCAKLNTLYVRGVPELSGRLGFLAELPDLTTLGVSGGLADADLAVLKNKKMLVLVLDGCARVTAAGLEHLAGSRDSLTGLNVTSTGVKGRAGAEAVARFTNLVSLTAVGVGWNDDDVALLRATPKLQTLYLSGNSLTDRCAETLRELRELVTLLLIGTDLSDPGLKRLRDNKNLVHLHLQRTKVTLTGVKAFQDTLPACAVGFDYTPADDPDRRLAEWVIGHGGEVGLIGDPKSVAVLDVRDVAKLPPGPLRVCVVGTSANANSYRMTDADIARFRDCPRVYKLASPGVQTDLTDAGYKALSELPAAPRFEHLVLRAPKATAAGVAHLAKCPNLITLDVSGANLGDVGLPPLPALPRLARLTAEGCKLTDAGVADLHTRRLSLLKLANNPGISAGAAAGLLGPNLPGNDLAALDLEGTGADDKVVLRAAQLVHLRSLSVRNTAVTDVGLAALVGKPTLETLDARGTKVTVPGAKRFLDVWPALPKGKRELLYDYNEDKDPDRRLAAWLLGKGGTVALSRPALKVTDLAQLPAGEVRVGVAYKWDPQKNPYAVTDADLDYFRDTGTYHFVMGTLNAFTDAGLDKFTRFPDAGRIKVLVLGSPKVTPEGYKHLKRLASLEQIHFGYLKVTDAVLAACGEIKTLTWINLQQGAFTAAGLRHLSKLPLTHLNLTETDTDDDGLEAVAGIAGMEKLVLHRTKVTNAGMARLAGMKKLAWLDVSGTEVTDDGMKAIAALPALQGLEAADTGLTDAGLKLLERVPTLTELDVRNTKVTPDGLAAFRKARPKCVLK
jgi:serine/threonine protein kinase/Leucine-rich repeat (LRR) protein